MSVVTERVGQVMMIGFRGTVMNDEIIEMITKYKVGSIVLNQQNVVDAEQVKNLTRTLQEVAKRAGHEQPLLIATDQEGGMLATIRDAKNITQFPGALALSSTTSPEVLIYQVAKAVALELLAIGINWILGPVLDILSNPSNHLLGVRTFGRTSSEVSRYASACARGFHDVGIATCGKHFPGYGNAFVSSSAGVPVINESKEQLRDNLAPYQACLRDNTLDSILVGGAVIPKVSGQLSAFLSSKVMKTLLRSDLKFTGLVVSDCLQMESIHNEIGIPQAAIMALWAGCDLLLNCHNRAWQLQVLVALEEAVNAGVLPLKLISGAAERVSDLKRKRISWTKALDRQPVLPDMDTHHALASAAYNQCVQVVRDNDRILPLSREGCILLLTPLVRDYHAKERRDEAEMPEHSLLVGESSFQDFGRRLGRYCKVIHTSYTANGMSAEQEVLLARSTAVIVITADGLRNLYQISFTKHLSIVCKSAQKSFCVMAISNPFDFWHEEIAAPTYLVSHEMTEQALVRAVHVLMCGPAVTPDASSEAEIATSLPSASSALKQTFPVRSRWMTSPWLQNDKLSAYLAAECRNIPHASITEVQELLTQPGYSVICVKNPNTSEVYGMAIVLFNELLLLTVLESHRYMSIGYSLLRRAIEITIQGNYSQLYLRHSAEGTAFLGALGVTTHDKDGKSYLALDDYEFKQ